ncbi:craniofacial development protein 2-like [Calliphora vicina]|uniref:craniofacial development protein 2-like n=1 Tax=Calliphora vicina TaxID=7373 RepID=UPI00325B70EC
MGDFNAQVGNDNSNRERVMGGHGIGRLTENGELFTEMCLGNKLVVGGTIFPHKTVHKVTWVSPDHRTENQIDHIAISRTWRGSLLDVRNKRGADCSSDHHLLVGTIRLRVAAVKKGLGTHKRFDVQKLNDTRIKTAYTYALKDSAETNQTFQAEFERSYVMQQRIILDTRFMKGNSGYPMIRGIS